jgi:hypothetical protein
VIAENLAVIVGRVKRAGITSQSDVEALTDDELDAKLYPPTPTTGDRPLPDPSIVARGIL